MKRILALLLISTMVFTGVASLGEAKETPEIKINQGENLILEIHPLETMIAPEGSGYKSADETIATVSSSGEVKGLKEGETTITITQKGEEVAYALTVSDLVPTELMKKAIAIALNEWEEVGGQNKRIKKSNKYTKWRCKKPCEFNWCGAFIGWALDEAGVPLFHWKKVEPVGENDTQGSQEALPSKILNTHEQMDRVTRIPRPGYVVVYGESYNKTIHVGLVTHVEHIQGDRYKVSTVEGDAFNRINRFEYYYDAAEAALEEQKNIFSIEEENRPDERIHYDYLRDNWYVYQFAQTYK